jgi:hypothetical protein
MQLANVGGTTGVPLVPVTDEGLFVFFEVFPRKEYLPFSASLCSYGIIVPKKPGMFCLGLNGTPAGLF